MAGNKKAPENNGFDFPEELMSGEFDLEQLFNEIKDPRTSPADSVRKADQAYGILKQRSARLTKKRGLSDSQKEAKQRELDEKMAEVQRILAQGQTRRAPRPTDETVRVIAPSQDTKISSVESTIVDADEDEETLVFQREAVAKVLAQDAPTKIFTPNPQSTDSAQNLISKIENKDPQKPQTTGVYEVFAFASGGQKVDSTVAMLSKQMVKGIANEDTSPISDVTDIFESEPTQVENRFSKVCNAVTSLGFLEYERFEDFFRSFLNECQQRPRGMEELGEIFESLKETLFKASAEKYDIFHSLIKRVIEKPGKDIALANMAMKGSEIGTWKNGIGEALAKLEEEIKKPEAANVLPIPTMDFSHAMEEVLKMKKYEERLKEIITLFYEEADRFELLDELQTWIIKLEKAGKYEMKDVIIDTLEDLDLEFTVMLDASLNRLKVAEDKKILNFPGKRTERVVEENVQKIQEPVKKEEEDSKKKGVLMAFLKKYRGKLAMASSALALLGIVGVSVYNSKKDDEKAPEEESGLKVYNLDPSKIAESGVLGGVSGVPMEQVVSFDGAGDMVIATANGVGDGVILAEKEKAEAEALASGIALAKENVSKAGDKANEAAIDASLPSPEVKPVWEHKVKEGDTFFKVVEDFKGYYGFSEMQQKYSFLRKLDNWDLSVALRLIFNKENGRSRDLDIYKGSDKDIADTFRATPYEIFMEVFKFKHRSQRNFVKKYMENGGDFEVVLASIERGYFENADGSRMELEVEVKKKFEEKKASMRNKYHKRRGAVKDVKVTEVAVDEMFKFATAKAKNFVLDKLHEGEKIANVMTWMAQGWAFDEASNTVIPVIAEVKKTAERKTYKLDTGFGVIKGKKAVEDYLAGVEEARKQKEINENLSKSEKTWDEIALGVEISNNLEAGEKSWSEIDREMEVANNFSASEDAWNGLLAEKEMEEAWEQILDNIEIDEGSPDEIALGTKNEIIEEINA